MGAVKTRRVCVCPYCGVKYPDTFDLRAENVGDAIRVIGTATGHVCKEMAKKVLFLGDNIILGKETEGK